ncbi:MAG: isoaspartyl peptidase/L-asparaginase [Acidobacteriota bacterium]
MRLAWKLLPAIALALGACAAPDPAPAPAEAPATEPERLDWAIAIHGGAGTIPKSLSVEKDTYYADLGKALSLGRDMLADGAEALDVVEQVIHVLEDSPLFNAGKGSVFTNEGKNELDAAIMDGRDLNCGAISGVSTVKNPISLARKVMTDSKHVFFVREGAERFADQMSVERVEPDYFFVQRRWDALQKALEDEKAAEAEKHGTVGAVVLDKAGNLAAGTSTGGMTNKRFGRVGDVPVIGAGTYANNKTVAVSCTGWGEKFIRHNVAHDVSALMEYKGLSAKEAAETVIHQKLDKDDGGLIAVSHTGELALVFNSAGMFRGAADSTGRFTVGIWEEDVDPTVQ